MRRDVENHGQGPGKHVDGRLVRHHAQHGFHGFAGDDSRDHHLVVFVDLIAQHVHGLATSQVGHDEHVRLLEEQPGEDVRRHLPGRGVIVDGPDIDDFLFGFGRVFDTDEVAHITVGGDQREFPGRRESTARRARDDGEPLRADRPTP